MICTTKECQNEAICDIEDSICTSCLRAIIIIYERQKIIQEIEKRRDNRNNRNMSYNEYQEWIKSQN